jgi:hypothetical protein
MEVTGTIELSGIERLVIDQKDVWLREVTRTNQIVWRKEHTEKRRPHERMIQSIRGYISSGKHRVWVHLNTVNVEHLPKSQIGKKFHGPFELGSSTGGKPFIMTDDNTGYPVGSLVGIHKGNAVVQLR